MKNITEKICAAVTQMDNVRLPIDVYEKTRMHILDYYASCFAGYRVNGIFNTANKKIIMDMGGKEEASIMFSRAKVPVCNAAYMNAIYAHGADMDDGNSKSAGHIATHIMPAVFALAETVKCTWQDVLTAVNIGYDFFNNIAGSAQPILYQKGFHSTGVAGGIACAAACSKLLNLKEKEIYNAVSLAAVQSSGLILIDESGQMCKSVNPANAAKNGVICAKLAAMGIEAPRYPLESAKGWFNAFSCKENAVNMAEHAIQNFTIMEGYIKQYPTCRHTHSCIEAASIMHDKLNLFNIGIKDIEKIYIYIYASAIKSAGGILHPQSSDEAKFSITYATAVALCKGNFKMDDIIFIAETKDIREAEKKITLIEDETTYNKEMSCRGCKMKIVLNNGKEYIESISYPKGEKERQLTWKEISEKLYQCSNGIIAYKEAAELSYKCRKIDVEEQFCLMDEMFLED